MKPKKIDGGCGFIILDKDGDEFSIRLNCDGVIFEGGIVEAYHIAYWLNEFMEAVASGED